MMEVSDIQKEFTGYYSASNMPEVVHIERASYISLVGKGSPGTTIFYEMKTALKKFTVALCNHFKGTEKAFETSVLEIFYWYDEEQTGFVDIGNFYTTVDLAYLKYRMAIRVPEFINAKDITAVLESAAPHPFGNKLELFKYTAGKCVQVMHRGPFAGELQTLPVLQQFATDNQLVKSGMHHEIHLVDFEKGQSQQHLKTILRDPVKNR